MADKTNTTFSIVISNDIVSRPMSVVVEKRQLNDKLIDLKETY